MSTREQRKIDNYRACWETMQRLGLTSIVPLAREMGISTATVCGWTAVFCSNGDVRKGQKRQGMPVPLVAKKMAFEDTATFERLANESTFYIPAHGKHVRINRQRGGVWRYGTPFIPWFRDDPQYYADCTDYF